MFNRGHQCGCGGGCSNVIHCPANVFPTQTAPARVSPTQEVVRTNIFNTVVPHIHPMHTTTVNRHHTQNQHFFPRTQSTVNEFTEDQEFFPPFNAGTRGTTGTFGNMGTTGNMGNMGNMGNTGFTGFPVRRRRFF